MITPVAKKQKMKTPTLYKVLGTTMAVPAGILVRKAADAGWETVRGYPPPRNPAAPGVTWPDALAWAAFSGVLVAAGRLVAARGAAAAYQAVTGKLPPNVNADSAS
ncbi:Protein of unknown function [Modestobacter sp. DSM 44400]|uniref:DUF4235 domain-containing protein n=1 Tax=Modestobacter sp. DSM 44400 TaxID=1550230 RepID=UPI000898347B|nr:DUF4235 domain-containing protein [Modestobacter sp. DSM 44400]SDX86761.1 Protein of unknown function [Modestobacter sp. DSM 44400]